MMAATSLHICTYVVRKFDLASSRKIAKYKHLFKEVLKLRTLQKLLLRKNYHIYKPKCLKLAKHENSIPYFDFAFVGG